MARSCTSDSTSSGAAVVANRWVEAEMRRSHTAAPLDLLVPPGVARREGWEPGSLASV